MSHQEETQFLLRPQTRQSSSYLWCSVKHLKTPQNALTSCQRHAHQPWNNSGLPICPRASASQLLQVQPGFPGSAATLLNNWNHLLHPRSFKGMLPQSKKNFGKIHQGRKGKEISSHGKILNPACSAPWDFQYGSWWAWECNATTRVRNHPRIVQPITRKALGRPGCWSCIRQLTHSVVVLYMPCAT